MEGKEANGVREDFVRWFSEIHKEDIPMAGGKGANLGEMYNSKFPIPPGFVVTAQAYRYFIESTGIANAIQAVLRDLDIEKTEKLDKISAKIKEMIISSNMPADLQEEIIEAYEVLDVEKTNFTGYKGSALDILRTVHEPPFVAVRSSATSEDLADASFAGQQDSFLNVRGKKDLIKQVKACFASLFNARAIYYRTRKGFDHLKANLAVVVQKMVDSDRSGVMFSKNPVGVGDMRNTVLIEAVYGLGEGIVSGRINPDSYVVSENLEDFQILDKKVGNKKIAIVRNSGGENVLVKLTEEKAKTQVLDNYQIKRLAQYSKQLEEHYKKPQDIEFAIENKEIYIVQSRPITTLTEEKEDKKLELSGKLILSGLGASPGIGSGPVKIVRTMQDLSKITKGDILVTEMTNPDMVVSMQKAAGIVTDEGGLTSHAAIVSREMGIPCIVGTETATKDLSDGQLITVDGNFGKVYEGKTENKLAEIKPIVITKTKIKVIIDLPDFAERAALSGTEAAGLVRLEGIIAESGKHPLFYIKQGKVGEYTNVLVKGLRKIAKPFKEIWVRSSDIRTDEFRHLKGASEEIEGNPMLGDHGIRFSLKHQDIMKAEISAVRLLASEFKNKKFGIMVPQVILLDELQGTKKIANEIGMLDNMKIGIMVETPAAVQVIEDFCKEGIDFISFGTNDLTQYTLAIDRNNGDVQYIYDEMNPAVLSAISYVIRRCKKYKVETSICGQAGSKPEMAAFLVKEGIDSLSVNADAAYAVSKVIAEIESQINFDAKKKIIAEEIGNDSKELSNDSNMESVEEVMPGSEVIEQEKEIKHPAEIKQKHKSNVQEVLEEDMESIVLKELEGEIISGQDEYQPGGEEGKSEEVPSLNEAITVDSSYVEDNEEEPEKEGDNQIEEQDIEDNEEKEEEQYTENEEILDIF